MVNNSKFYTLLWLNCHCLAKIPFLTYDKASQPPKIPLCCLGPAQKSQLTTSANRILACACYAHISPSLHLAYTLKARVHCTSEHSKTPTMSPWDLDINLVKQRRRKGPLKPTHEVQEKGAQITQPITHSHRCADIVLLITYASQKHNHDISN